MDLLVAHDIGLPEIVGADDDAIPLELFAALEQFVLRLLLSLPSDSSRFVRPSKSWLLRSLVIHFDLRLVADGPDHLVLPVIIWSFSFKPAQHLDIGGAGDSGLHFAELGLARWPITKTPCNLFLAGLFGRRIELGGRLRAGPDLAASAPDRPSAGRSAPESE